MTVRLLLSVRQAGRASSWKLLTPCAFITFTSAAGHTGFAMVWPQVGETQEIMFAPVCGDLLPVSQVLPTRICLFVPDYSSVQTRKTMTACFGTDVTIRNRSLANSKLMPAGGE